MIEFKNDTFAGQVTEKFEEQSVDLGFIDKAIEGPELKDYTPQAWRPSYRDVGDTQQEIIGEMRMDFEEKRYNLESSLREEENRRRRVEDNLEEIIRVNNNRFKELSRELREKNERISLLEDQLRTRNFSQFDRDSTNKEIQELKAEVSRLENERDDLRQKIRWLEKDLDDTQISIQELERQVNEKQGRIEELEKQGVSPSSQREIAQLRKEKDDLEKQLQAQKKRTELVEEERDKWKRFSKKDETRLATSEEKILSLTKERDDLNKSIEALRKVNSKKVKEFENYKVEAEKKLNKAREEYAQEKADLENSYKKEKADLESAISILENEKKEGFSKNEIDNLKSLLEGKDMIIQRKDITIKNLEDESYRLRDLNLSLKSINEGNNKEEYDGRLKEIEDQKSRVEEAKDTLEENLREYVQEIENKETENKRLKEAIDSYISQLEKLNKEKSRDRKLLIASQNDFTKVQEKNRDLRRDVLQLEREKKAVEQREELLKNSIATQQERIEEKDKENTEYVKRDEAHRREKEEFNRKEKTFQQNIRDKDEKLRQKNVTLSRQKEELEELRKRKEKAEDVLEHERFNRLQYERLQTEYNALVESADRQINQGVRDKDQLEEELKEREKKIQELERDRVDPKEYENMVRDNKDLKETIGYREQDVRETTKIINQLHDEKIDIERKYKNAKDSLVYQQQKYEEYKQKVEKEERDNQRKLKNSLQKIRQNYNNQVTKLQERLEKQKKNYEFKLSQRLRPGDIKSVQVLLNNLNLDDLDEENYAEAQLNYRTARDNFARKANDETSSKVQRLMFEELKKLADIRLDLLNMSFNYPAKTEAGKEFIRRTDQTLAGKFYRFRMRIGKYLAGTTLGAGIMGMFYYIYELLKATASGSRYYASHYGYPVATKIGKAFADSSKITKAIVISGAATFVDKSREDGFINTLYNWVNNLIYGVEYTLKSSAKAAEYAADVVELAVKTSADVAKYVGDNTSTVFLMIVSAIGILVTLKYSREK